MIECKFVSLHALLIMSSAKEKMYAELSRVTGALSSPKRLEITDLLSQKAFSVEELSEEIGMSVAATSRHLQVLKEARLTETVRSGKFIYYRISDDVVWMLAAVLKNLGNARLAEYKALKEKQERGDVKTVRLSQLMKKKTKKNRIMLDVRPEQEYAAGHIRGAISIPLSQLPARLKELPENREIVVYCRGPLCVMASEAVSLLQKKKFTALKLEEGYTDWKVWYEQVV